LFYSQGAVVTGGSQREVGQRDDAELTTDGVQALQKSISAYKGVSFQVNAHKTTARYVYQIL